MGSAACYGEHRAAGTDARNAESEADSCVATVARSGVPCVDSDRQRITVDEHEVSAVHDAGSRLVSGTTLAEPAARPARAAFSRFRALIVVA
jgi:hypothetical protein